MHGNCLGYSTGRNLSHVMSHTKKQLLPIGTLSNFLHHNFVPIDTYAMILYVNIWFRKYHFCLWRIIHVGAIIQYLRKYIQTWFLEGLIIQICVTYCTKVNEEHSLSFELLAVLKIPQETGQRQRKGIQTKAEGSAWQPHRLFKNQIWKYIFYTN